MRITMSAFLFARAVASHTIHTDAATIATGDPDAARSHAAELCGQLTEFAPADMVLRIRQLISDHIELGLKAVADGSSPSVLLRLHADARGAVTIVDEHNLTSHGLTITVSAIGSDDQHDGVLEDWLPMSVRGSTIVIGRIAHDLKGRFQDGSVVMTSQVSTPTADLREGVMVETLNSRYLLGRPAIAEAQSEDRVA